MTEPPATTDESAADPTFGGLGGVTWTLMSYGDAENPTVVLDDTLITLEFALEGISGDAGCNRYNAGFSYEGNTLSISPIAATRRACDEPIMTQEFFYLSALGAATGFQREEDTLQIFYIDLETREQDVLTFTAQ
jgi:heat shock protein HslJ